MEPTSTPNFDFKPNLDYTPGSQGINSTPGNPSIYTDLPAQLLYVKDSIAPQVKSASNVAWYFNDANLGKTVDQHEQQENQKRQEANQLSQIKQGLEKVDYGSYTGTLNNHPGLGLQGTQMPTFGTPQSTQHGLPAQGLPTQGSAADFQDFWKSYGQQMPGDKSQYGYLSQPVDLTQYNTKMGEGMDILNHFPQLPKEPAVHQPNVWALAAAAIGAALTPEHAWDIAAAPFQFELGEQAKSYKQLQQQYEQAVQIAQAKLGWTRDQAQGYLQSAFQDANAKNQALNVQANQLFQGRLQNADSWNKAFLDYFNNAENFKRLDYSNKMDLAMTALRFGNDPSLPPQMRQNAGQFFKSITGNDPKVYTGQTPQNIALDISNKIAGTNLSITQQTSGAMISNAKLQPDLTRSEIRARNTATAGQAIDNLWKPRLNQSELDLREKQGAHLSAETDVLTGTGGAGNNAIRTQLEKLYDDQRQLQKDHDQATGKMAEVEGMYLDATNQKNKDGSINPRYVGDPNSPDWREKAIAAAHSDPEYIAAKQTADGIFTPATKIPNMNPFEPMNEVPESGSLADIKQKITELEGRAKQTPDVGSKLYESATNFFNQRTKYEYGADGKNQAYDCSSAICKIYKDAGIKLPRTSGEQFKISTPVTDGKVRVGDLVFFRGTDTKHKGQNDISHVGMIYGFDADGNPLMLHQSSSKNETMIVDLKNNAYFMKHLAGIGRVKQ